MQASQKQKLPLDVSNSYGRLILPVFSLVSLATTFFVSISDLKFEVKTAVFFGIILFYLLICAAFYIKDKRRADAENAKISEAIFSSDVERHLLALEEASQFFGASLKPADMFRLVGSRVGEIIPFAAAALFWVDEEKGMLKSVGACGENARELASLEINSLKGLAGKVFISRKIQRDENLLLEKNVISTEALKDLESAIAAPLVRGAGSVFAVLVLYGDGRRKFAAGSRSLLEAVAERIAPLFISSLAFEKSLSNALTDSLTNLPNERAFYLILENQMAESQRQNEQRPLTILTIDVQSFAEINRKFGHATGDRILYFAADNIKAQLRKMDFLSRSTADEFLIVLPTASETIADEIVERIEKAFANNPFEIGAGDKIYLQLNFGTATFLRDGETAQQLLTSARLKKQKSKSGQAGSRILLFPK